MPAFHAAVRRAGEVLRNTFSVGGLGQRGLICRIYKQVNALDEFPLGMLHQIVYRPISQR